MAAGAGVLRALFYATLHTHLGNLRRMVARPLQLVLVASAVLGLVALQTFAITTQTEVILGSRARAGATAGLCVALAVMSVTAVRACPIRLRGADVAWLLPCPSGPRALVAWNIGGLSGRAAVFGVAAAIVAALRAGELAAVMWQPAVAVAAATLLVRGVSYGTHLLTVHGVPRAAAGSAGALLWSVAALPDALAAAGGGLSLPMWLERVGRRLLASALLVSLVYVVMLAGWSLTQGPGRGPAVLALGAVLAGACWSLCASLLGSRPHAR